MSILRQSTGDITQGSIARHLLAFFFPLWFGTFFQQLYNTVDTVVVGRFVGKTAQAAVGSTGGVVNLTVGIFTGIASGAVVLIAQHYGARHAQGVQKGVHTAMLLALLMGAVFTVLGVALTPWSLAAMGTTPEALPGAVLYLRIYFWGMIPPCWWSCASCAVTGRSTSSSPGSWPWTGPPCGKPSRWGSRRLCSR